MKLSLLAATAAIVSVSFSARADEPQIARARFASTVGLPELVRAACSFDPVSTFDGQAHTFEVRVEGSPCSSAPSARGIPVFVRIESDEVRRVIVEAPALDGVDPAHLQRAIVDITMELERRVARLTPPAPPPVHVSFVSDQPITAPVWTHTWKRANPGLFAGGILMVVAGSLAAVGGTVAGATNAQNGSAAPGLLIATGGVAAFSVGICMINVGGKKVPRIAANVSPTGGSLRLAF